MCLENLTDVPEPIVLFNAADKVIVVPDISVIFVPEANPDPITKSPTSKLVTLSKTIV